MSKKKLTKKRKKQLLAMFMTAGMVTNTFISTGVAFADTESSIKSNSTSFSDFSDRTYDPQIGIYNLEKWPTAVVGYGDYDTSIGTLYGWAQPNSRLYLYGVPWDSNTYDAVVNQSPVIQVDSNGHFEITLEQIYQVKNINPVMTFMILAYDPIIYNDPHIDIYRSIQIGFAENAFSATISANDFTMEYGEEFNEAIAIEKAGAQAINGNGQSEGVKMKSSNVDTSKPGTYSVTFVSDSGKEITVTVTVNEAPADNATITAHDATVEYGSTWNDSVAKQVTGVKATDRYGNDVTNNVTVSGNVDTNKPGNYNVTFTSPESGKSTTVVITVKEGVKAETPVFDTPYIYGDDLRGKTSPNATVRLRINSLGVIDITVQADENGDFSIPVEKLKQYENYKVGSKLFADASFGTDSSNSEMEMVTVEENHSSIEANDFEVDYGFDLTDEAAIEKAGAKATDKYGKSEGVKVKESNVDTSKPGEYSITFVSDSGKEKTVKVTVKNKPIIGSEPIIHATDTTYQVGETLNPLLGVTAEDPEDGDLTDQVQADASGVNMSKAGDYELKLSVTDKDGNTTEQTVTVHVIDQVTDGPVIKGADDVRVDERAKFDPLEGVTAQDSQGNDLTDNLTYTGSVDTSTPGEYTIKYYVYDKEGKVATAERVVTVQSDASKPVVMSPDKLTIKQNSKFDPTLYAQAYDNEDGDITDQIKVLGQIYTDKLGSQFITYEVTDSDGNKATKMMEVEVVATLGNAPVISGADDLEINVGDTFDPISGVTAYDKEDGDLTSEIKYGGIVDTGKAGEYTVTYTVWDSDFNTETVERKVTVKDPTVEPAIEAHDFEVDYGFDLTDEAAIEKAEAKATDKYGKEEAVTVKETNVDTSKPGE
ncbi:immunoglobulin-like domain-containing protein, partial [Enterococcus mundtii]